jgi:hypothetical protein
MVTQRKRVFNRVADEGTLIEAVFQEGESGKSASERGVVPKFKGQFPVSYEYQDWFRDYLKELGFSSAGKALDKQLKSRWRPADQGYRTADNRLIIRPSYKLKNTGLPNFVNLTNNFQIYWDKHALVDAKSNINILSFDHFLELVVWPSRDYHDPLKVNEVFAPTAYNCT